MNARLIFSAVSLVILGLFGCENQPCPENYLLLKVVVYDEVKGQYEYLDRTVKPDSNLINTFNYYGVPICVRDSIVLVDSTYLRDMNYIDNLINKSRDPGWLLDHIGRVH